MIITESCVEVYLEFGLVLSTISGQELLIFTEHRHSLQGIYTHVSTIRYFNQDRTLSSMKYLYIPNLIPTLLLNFQGYTQKWEWPGDVLVTFLPETVSL